MPKQQNLTRPKAKQPAKAKQPPRKRPPKAPRTPTFNALIPAPMASPELKQPSTASKASFSRQAGEQPDLNPAQEIFRRSHERIMTARAPETQILPKSAVAAFTQQTIFERLLTQHQDEIRRLREELKAEKRENAELRAKLVAAQAVTSKKRRRLSDRLSDPEN